MGAKGTGCVDREGREGQALVPPTPSGMLRPTAGPLPGIAKAQVKDSDWKQFSLVRERGRRGCRRKAGAVEAGSDPENLLPVPVRGLSFWPAEVQL